MPMPTDLILELAEELTDPTESILEDQVDDTIDTELDALSNIGSYDDDIIDLIASGKRLTNSDPIDFTEYD